jgi:hypothetical protein
MIINVGTDGYIVSVVREKTADGKDTHAKLVGGEYLKDKCFQPETNQGRITPEMQKLLDGMETIDLSSGQRIGGAFSNCPSLSAVTIPSNALGIFKSV